MSSAALLWAFVYFAGLAASFINPVYGLLTYLLEYYQRPALHWWGKDLPDLRWNLTVSIVVLFTLLLRRDALPKLSPVRNPAAAWLIGLGVVMLLVSPIAVRPDKSWDYALAYWKLIALYAVIVGLIRTQWAFDAFVATHIAGAAWWGIDAYMYPKRVHGRLMRIGSSDTLNDNQASAHLLTILPLIIVFLLTAKDKRLRLLGLFAAPLVINTLILCNSRGATLGVAVTLAVTVVLVPWKQRFQVMAVGAAMVGAFFMLADQQFLTRQQTTSTYEEDGSAMGRLESWKGGARLIADHPLGVGGKGYAAMSPIYIPEIVAAHNGQERASHNTIVQTTAEWGIPGLIMFLGFLLSTFLLLHRVRKRASGADWFYYRSLGVQLGLTGMLVAAFFTDRLYGESLYWTCGLAAALYRIQHTALAGQAGADSAPVAAPAVGWSGLEHAAARQSVLGTVRG